MKLVLASSSPRRAELLKTIIPNFEINPADISEKIDPNISAIKNTERIATEKSRAVFNSDEDKTVIGCDTLGELDGWVFGKPNDKNEATEMLKKLSGKTHTVVSGFCIKTDFQEIIGHSATDVTFRKLSSKEIEKYIAENPVTSYAGAYAIQGSAKSFVTEVDGKIETVIGFPLKKIKNILLRILNI